MELYGIKVNNEPTIRQMEAIELAQKDSKSNIGLMVEVIAILKDKEETKTVEEIKNIIYDLSAKEINNLAKFVETIGGDDKKKYKK